MKKLIYAIIFTFSVGILSGCASAKDYTEDTHGQFRVETKDNLLEKGKQYLTQTSHTRWCGKFEFLIFFHAHI